MSNFKFCTRSFAGKIIKTYFVDAQELAANAPTKTRPTHKILIVDASGSMYGDITPILNQLAGDNPQLMLAWASGYNTVAPQVAQVMVFGQVTRSMGTTVTVLQSSKPDFNSPKKISEVYSTSSKTSSRRSELRI